jgi:non-specific serine/threonine protein kinase/serine/threonine-protein kinase
MNGLAGAYQNAGRPQDAVTLFDEALELSRHELGTNHAITIRLMCNTASAYQEAGRLDDALRLHQETTGLAKARLGPDHPQTSRSMSNLAWAYAVSGDMERASSLFTEALKAQNARLGPEHPDTLVTLANFANCRLRQSNYTNAETMARECFNRREKLTPNHWRTFEVQTTLGMALLGQKRYAEAETPLIQGYGGLKERKHTIPAGSRGQLNKAARALAELYDAWGKPDEAARWNRELRLVQP